MITNKEYRVKSTYYVPSSHYFTKGRMYQLTEGKYEFWIAKSLEEANKIVEMLISLPEWIAVEIQEREVTDWTLLTKRNQEQPVKG